MFKGYKAVMAAAVLCGGAAPPAVWAQLVDPTRPPDYVPSGAQEGVSGGSPWDLTSTLVSPQRTFAVINGQVVTKGDKIGDMTVEKIATGEVVLVGGGRTEVISLVGLDIKRPAGSGDQGRTSLDR